MSVATPTFPALLTVDETAEALRVSRATVYRLIDAGRLSAVRIGAGRRAHIRIRTDALAELLREHRRTDNPGGEA